MLKLVKVKMSEIKGAEYNPKHRSRERGLKRLVASIEKVGLVYPLLLDEATKTIIDGHRRYGACKLMGWEEVPCLLSSGEPADTMYAEVNATQKALNGNDMVHVYLKHPDAVTEATRAKFLRAESVIGRKALVTIARRGMALSVFTEAERVGKLCGITAPEHVSAIVRWFLAFGMMREIREAIKNGLLRADKFCACVDKMKPLRISYQAAN